MKKNSDFVLKMDESVTLAAANRAKALKAQGRDIIEQLLKQSIMARRAFIHKLVDFQN